MFRCKTTVIQIVETLVSLRTMLCIIVSLYYRQDNWNVGVGVRNVFDKEPPMVDGIEIQSKSNVPLGYGYNINGRSYFMNVLYRF